MEHCRQVHLLAFEQDELVAIGLAVNEPWHAEPLVRPIVPPAHRRRGLGSALLGELSRWAASDGTTPSSPTSSSETRRASASPSGAASSRSAAS